jgi:transcriptional regulator with XRE-family HTH domain
MESENGAQRLGALIADVRAKSGLDLRKFAALCVKDDGKAIGFSTLNKVERGFPPSGEVLRAIARNPYIAKDYTLAALYQELQGIEDDNPLAKQALFTAHQIIPYADKISDEQKRDLIIHLVNDLSRDSKMTVLQTLLDSFTQPRKRK